MVPPKIRALLVDLSGTLHVGDTPTPGSSIGIQQLREAGVVLRWLSNTSKESRHALLERMKRMDLDVREDELFTSLSAVSELVSLRNLRPLYLLSDSALEDFPATDPPYDSVVVGLAPASFNYQKLNEAFRLLSSDKIEKPAFIATHKAVYVRSSDGELSLGPGPFITALEEASGVKAEVVGKPTRGFFELALRSLEKDGITSNMWSSVGMIGDDWRQDVSPVTDELNLQRFLVKTGKYRDGDEKKIEESGSRPVLPAESFSAVVNDILVSTS